MAVARGSLDADFFHARRLHECRRHRMCGNRIMCAFDKRVRHILANTRSHSLSHTSEALTDLNACVQGQDVRNFTTAARNTDAVVGRPVGWLAAAAAAASAYRAKNIIRSSLLRLLRLLLLMLLHLVFLTMWSIVVAYC